MDLRRVRLLYSLISHNQRLQDRRHPMFEKNMAMKIFGYFFISIWAVYMMVFGVALAFAFEDTAYEPFDWIDGGLIFFLIIDFFARFAMQETPAQNIKQYKLLNIPTSFLLNTFLLRMGLQLYNLFWAFFFVPFGVITVLHFYGLTGLVAFLAGWWMMFVLNSYWYLFWRTFLNKNFLTIIIPVAFYALVIYFGIFFDEDNTWLFNNSMLMMREFINLNPLCWLCALALAAVLFAINHHFQKAAIYEEIAKTEQVKKVNSNNMLFLDKFGLIGEYLKLEIKSTMRNLVVRKQFISGVIFMTLLCSLFAFTDVYDGMPFMRIFICVYCFSCLGVMTLTTIMCAEGNYIDGLMVRKETVLTLLKAKYYFHCVMLLVPLVFSFMPIYEEKITIEMALGCLFFTSGGVFPFLFQLAAYNDSAIHLNEKLTKAGRDTKMQMLMSFVALFLPMFIMYALVQLLDVEIASYVMITLGLIGTLTHPLWLRNIYERFMKKRYAIMDGFRNSR